MKRNDTDRLIESLVHDVRPVRRMAPLSVRVLMWLAVAVTAAAIMVAWRGLKPDIVESFNDLRFVLEFSAALLTGVAAAVAAFAATVPGASRILLWLPLPPALFWLGTLGVGCLKDWLDYGMEGLAIRPDLVCLQDIALMGALPALLMVFMLGRARPLAPSPAAMLGALAAAAVGAAALRLYHPQDAGMMVLVWQVGSVLLLSALGGMFGRPLLARAAKIPA